MNSMSWRAVSEIVVGKMVKNKLDPLTVNVNDVWPDFKDIVAYLQGESDPAKRSVSSMLDILGHALYDSVLDAERASENNDAEFLGTWPHMLKQAASRYRVGEKLSRYGKKLQGGEPVPVEDIVSQATNLDLSRRSITTGDNIDSETAPFLPSYWQPLDFHVGGLPKDGLTVVGAPPGTGKTTLLLRLAIQTVKNGHPVLLFSMEMPRAQLMARLEHMCNTLTTEQKHLISVCDEPMSAAEVASTIASMTPKPYFVGVDFAELMLVGDAEDAQERIMASVYQRLVNAAKRLHVPIVLLSQLSRNYDDGLPRVTHLRYTGMAEALAALILLIYNPGAVFAKMSSNGSLPNVKDRAYVIVGKSRYGHNQMKVGGIGAMQIEWTGKGGWGEHPVPTISEFFAVG